MGKSVEDRKWVTQESETMFTGESGIQRLRRYIAGRLRLSTTPQMGDDGKSFVRDEALAAAMEYFGIRPDAIGIREVTEVPQQFSAYASAPVFAKGKPTSQQRGIHFPSTFRAPEKFGTIARRIAGGISSLPRDVISYIGQQCGGMPRGIATLPSVNQENVPNLNLYGDHRYRVDYTNYRLPDPREGDKHACMHRAQEISSRLRQMVESGSYSFIKVRRRSASPSSPPGDEWRLMVYRFAPDPVKHFLRLLYPTGANLRPRNVRITKDNEEPPDIQTWEYPKEEVLDHNIPYVRGTITFAEHSVDLVRRSTAKLASRYTKVLLSVIPFHNCVEIGSRPPVNTPYSGVCIEEYVQS